MAVPVPSISCCVLNHHNLFYQMQNALAFNRDTYCHLVLCLQLLPFHSHQSYSFFFTENLKMKDTRLTIISGDWWSSFQMCHNMSRRYGDTRTSENIWFHIQCAHCCTSNSFSDVFNIKSEIMKIHGDSFLWQSCTGVPQEEEWDRLHLTKQ